MKGQWKCQIEKPPSVINVGDELFMSCDGDEPVLLSAPLQIRPLNRDPYSIIALDTVNIEKHFLALKFVSYRTGTFHSPFYITDGKQAVLIKDGISFQVQSVLTDQDVKPIGPIGGFESDIFEMGFLGVSIFWVGIVSLIVFVCRLIKRKCFIRKVMARNHYSQPDKVFVLALKSKKDLNPADLDRFFKSFLEDRFFIPAQGLKTKKILKKLKKEHPLVYKKDGVFVRRVLDELFYSAQPLDPENFLKIKQLTQEAVFYLSGKSNRSI